MCSFKCSLNILYTFKQDIKAYTNANSLANILWWEYISLYLCFDKGFVSVTHTVLAKLLGTVSGHHVENERAKPLYRGKNNAWRNDPQTRYLTIVSNLHLMLVVLNSKSPHFNTHSYFWIYYPAFSSSLHIIFNRRPQLFSNRFLKGMFAHYCDRLHKLLELGSTVTLAHRLHSHAVRECVLPSAFKQDKLTFIKIPWNSCCERGQVKIHQLVLYNCVKNVRML